MYKFPKSRWISLDLNEIYNYTRTSKEEALETGFQTDHKAPASHGISCSCCGKIITESTTHPTLEESTRKRRHGIFKMLQHVDLLLHY
ncbi:hypothetical protein BH18THE2_BH18THE2_30170 [soil metagenome]